MSSPTPKNNLASRTGNSHLPCAPPSPLLYSSPSIRSPHEAASILDVLERERGDIPDDDRREQSGAFLKLRAEAQEVIRLDQRGVGAGEELGSSACFFVSASLRASASLIPRVQKDAIRTK